MRDTDLFQLALGLVPPWLVKAVRFDAEAKRHGKAEPAPRAPRGRKAAGDLLS